MVRKDFQAHRDSSEAEPRKDDGGCHYDNEPERRGSDKCSSERLSRRPIVVRQRHYLDPNKSRCGPSKEPMRAFKAVMGDLSELRICECDNPEEKYKYPICNSHSQN